MPATTIIYGQRLTGQELGVEDGGHAGGQRDGIRRRRHAVCPGVDGRRGVNRTGRRGVDRIDAGRRMERRSGRRLGGIDAAVRRHA